MQKSVSFGIPYLVLLKKNFRADTLKGTVPKIDTTTYSTKTEKTGSTIQHLNKRSDSTSKAFQQKKNPYFYPNNSVRVTRFFF